MIICALVLGRRLFDLDRRPVGMRPSPSLRDVSSGNADELRGAAGPDGRGPWN